MANVLIVDDEKGLRNTIEQFLHKEGHDTRTAEDVKQATGLLEDNEFDVVVTDIIMPGANGVDLLKAVKDVSPRTQVILITGEPTVETASEAVREGAFDYLAKPVTRARLVAAVSSAVRVKGIEDENVQYRENLESLVEKRTESLQKTLMGTAQALSGAVEMRDPYTAGHQRSVTHLACAIYDLMELPSENREGLRLAGLVHDLGKLRIPADILTKPTRLSRAEFELIKEHPDAGWEILKGVDFPWPVADMARQHHERLDGSGYPDGLKGGVILIESRILAVADVVEAMASHRPYRPALGIEAALAEIKDKRGTIFDPQVVDACLALFNSHAFELNHE